MKKIILGIILVIILGFVGWYLYTALKPETKQEPSPFENIGAQTNPLEDKVPELNPVETANPFSGSYKNPFQK